VPSAAKPLLAGPTVRRSRLQTRTFLKVAVELIGAGHREWIGNDKSALRPVRSGPLFGSPRNLPSCAAAWRRGQFCASACCISPHFPRRVWKGGASQGAEKPFQAVIPSPFAVILSPSLSFRSRSRGRGISPCPLSVYCARNLALSVFKTMRESSSSANKNGGLLGTTRQTGFPAACSAPLLQGPPDYSCLPCPRSPSIDGLRSRAQIETRFADRFT
jgi:hypothetical protein